MRAVLNEDLSLIPNSEKLHLFDRETERSLVDSPKNLQKVG